MVAIWYCKALVSIKTAFAYSYNSQLLPIVLRTWNIKRNISVFVDMDLLNKVNPTLEMTNLLEAFCSNLE